MKKKILMFFSIILISVLFLTSCDKKKIFVGGGERVYVNQFIQSDAQYVMPLVINEKINSFSISNINYDNNRELNCKIYVEDSDIKYKDYLCYFLCIDINYNSNTYGTYSIKSLEMNINDEIFDYNFSNFNITLVEKNVSSLACLPEIFQTVNRENYIQYDTKEELTISKISSTFPTETRFHSVYLDEYAANQHISLGYYTLMPEYGDHDMVYVWYTLCFDMEISGNKKTDYYNVKAFQFYDDTLKLYVDDIS